MTSTPRRTLAALLAVSLLAVACDDGDADDDAGDTTTTMDTTETTDSTAVPPEGDADDAGFFRRDLLTTTEEVPDDLARELELQPVGADELPRVVPGFPDDGDDQLVETLTSLVRVYRTGGDPVERSQRLTEAGVDGASPVFMLSFSGHWVFFDADGPHETAEQPNLPDDAPTDGPIVAVADTGLLADRPEALPGVVTAASVLGGQGDVDLDDASSSAVNVGHGTFVASILRQALPDARVVVARVGIGDPGDYVSPSAESPPRDAYVSDGLALLVAVIRLVQAQERLGRPFAALNLSLGTLSSGSSRGDGALGRAIEHWYANTDAPEPNVYASAGNSGPNAAFWPATRDDVVGVGSLTGDGDPSCFSGVGDVDEIGENLVGLGVLEGEPAPVRWSGTSFATPIRLAVDLGGDPSRVTVDPAGDAPVPC